MKIKPLKRRPGRKFSPKAWPGTARWWHGSELRHNKDEGGILFFEKRRKETLTTQKRKENENSSRDGVTRSGWCWRCETRVVRVESVEVLKVLKQKEESKSNNLQGN
jgi:hypothetical protein